MDPRVEVGPLDGVSEIRGVSFVMALPWSGRLNVIRAIRPVTSYVSVR